MKKSGKKTDKNASNPKKKEPMSAEKKLILKISLLFVIFGAIVCGIFFLCRYLYNAVYAENSNYLLRNVEVISNGFWDDKDSLLVKHLQLKVNRTSIFQLDTDDIRAQIMKIPGIKDCEIKRVLPDTLQLRLIERVPRAKIPRYPQYLVDEEGIILLKKLSMLPTTDLPIIAGIAPGTTLEANKVTPEFTNAMKIIVTTLRYYSDINIIGVNVRDKDFLTFYVRYKTGSRRTAVMPNSAEGIDIRLKALRTALIRSHNMNDNISTFNLSFDGKVVCQ